LPLTRSCVSNDPSQATSLLAVALRGVILAGRVAATHEVTSSHSHDDGPICPDGLGQIDSRTILIDTFPPASRADVRPHGSDFDAPWTRQWRAVSFYC
jgi:hypothetical protein